MARAQARYVCQQCGTAHPKWAGRCDDCGGWNTLVEEAGRETAPKGLGSAKGRKLAFVGLEGVAQAMARRLSGMAEFDRVCGGGLVPGSALRFGPGADLLKALPIALPRWHLPTAIFTLKGRTLSPVAQVFADCVRDVAKPLARNEQAL